jgi:hypothetical protein
LWVVGFVGWVDFLASVASAETTAPITLVVELPVGSPIDRGRLEAALARELGSVPLAHEPTTSGGTLRVHQEGQTVEVSFDGPGGRHNARSLALDSDDPVRAPEDEIALVAVNVALDQTAAFRLPEAPPPPIKAAPVVPAPVRAPPSPCERSRALAPRTPIGVDFAPYAGTSAYDRGSVRTVSVGVLGATSSGIHGAAMSGLVNVDTGPVCGAELAGIANVSDGFEGAQLSGIANVAGNSVGVQGGLVNVDTGTLRGVQVGLVNVARAADAQIGLINIDLTGRLRVDTWSKPEGGLLFAGVKHGTAHTHWIYAVAMNAATGHPWATLGFGAHITPSEKLHVDVDGFEHEELINDHPKSTPNLLSELRAVVGYAFSPYISAFAGPTFNVLRASDFAHADAPKYAWAVSHGSSFSVQAWPGVALGVEVP